MSYRNKLSRKRTSRKRSRRTSRKSIRKTSHKSVSKSGVKSKLIELSKKLNQSYKGSTINRLADNLGLLGQYLSKSERLFILPYLSKGKVNTKIFKEHINDPKKPLPK